MRTTSAAKSRTSYSDLHLDFRSFIRSTTSHLRVRHPNSINCFGGFFTSYICFSPSAHYYGEKTGRWEIDSDDDDQSGRLICEICFLFLLSFSARVSTPSIAYHYHHLYEVEKQWTRLKGRRVGLGRNFDFFASMSFVGEFCLLFFSWPVCSPFLRSLAQSLFGFFYYILIPLHC